MDSLHLTLRSTPSDYGVLDAERIALREERALLDLRDHDVVDVLGDDRLSYLHTKLAQHALRFGTSSGGYTVATDIDGKLLFDAWCYALEDRVRMLLRPGTAASAIEHLDRYVIMEDVRFDRPDLRALAISGGSVATLALDDADVWSMQAHELGGTTVQTATLPHLAASPLQLVLAPESALDAAADALAAAGLVRVGTQALAEHQVAHGVAVVPRDVPFGEHIPLEAGLFHGISFAKGCYLGQEVIERLFSRGRPNKRLMQLSWSGSPVPPGTSIVAGEREAGVVTASAVDPNQAGTTRALGYVRRKYLAPDADAILVDGHEVAIGAYVGGENADV